MDTQKHFKHGDVDITVTVSEKEDKYSVDIQAEGNKEEVEAFMTQFVFETFNMDIPMELSFAKVGEEPKPLKVSDLMGSN